MFLVISYLFPPHFSFHFDYLFASILLREPVVRVVIPFPLFFLSFSFPFFSMSSSAGFDFIQFVCSTPIPLRLLPRSSSPGQMFKFCFVLGKFIS